MIKRKKNSGLIVTFEALLIFPIFIILLLFVAETFKYVYLQNTLTQVANYSISYWSKNAPKSCTNISDWLSNSVVGPTLKNYGIEPSSIIISANGTGKCNCPGNTISLYLKHNTKFFSNIMSKTISPSAYAIAIIEGDISESC